MFKSGMISLKLSKQDYKSEQTSDASFWHFGTQFFTHRYAHIWSLLKTYWDLIPRPLMMPVFSCYWYSPKTVLFSKSIMSQTKTAWETFVPKKKMLWKRINQKEEIIHTLFLFLLNLIWLSSELVLQAPVQKHPIPRAMCFSRRLSLPFKDILIGTFVSV